MKRSRLTYAVLICFTILIGIGSRKFPELFPEFLSLYLGDTSWALMVFLVIGFVWNGASTLYIGMAAMGFSFAIELSQLYHAPWIDALRHTTLGGLILGFGFIWSDLICYSVGIIIGMRLEKYFYSRVKIKE